MTLTVDDIRDSSKISGFAHVGVNNSGGTRGHGGGKPYFAKKRVAQGSGPGTIWTSTRRATAEEAAQDYCDYMNGQATPATPALKSAGHKRVTKVSSPAVQAARQALRDALAAEKASKPASRGYIYLVGETASNVLGHQAEHKWALIKTMAVKVGYSDDPPVDGRVAGLQTSNPRILVLLGTLRGTKGDESALHAKYIEDNVLQEWFRPTPELFSEFGVRTKAEANGTLCVLKGEA